MRKEYPGAEVRVLETGQSLRMCQPGVRDRGIRQILLVASMTILWRSVHLISMNKTGVLAARASATLSETKRGKGLRVDR